MKASEFYSIIYAELKKVHGELIKNDKHKNYVEYTKNLEALLSEMKFLRFLASTPNGRFKLATFAENLKSVNTSIFTRKIRLDKAAILQFRETSDDERPYNVRAFFVKAGRIVDDIQPFTFKEIRELWTNTKCRNFLFEVNIANDASQDVSYKRLMNTLFDLAQKQYGYKDDNKLTPKQADLLRESFSIVLQNIVDKDKNEDENDMC